MIGTVRRDGVAKGREQESFDTGSANIFNDGIPSFVYAVDLELFPSLLRCWLCRTLLDGGPNDCLAVSLVSRADSFIEGNDQLPVHGSSRRHFRRGFVHLRSSGGSSEAIP